MPIKANDFVEIEYTGRLKDGNIIFDTTNEAVAKVLELHPWWNQECQPHRTCFTVGEELELIAVGLIDNAVHWNIKNKNKPWFSIDWRGEEKVFSYYR